MSARSMRRRLMHLERETGSAKRPCIECGHDPSDTGPVRWHVPPPRVIGEPDDPNDDPSRDICSTCGWKRVWRISPPRILHPEEQP